MLLSRFYFSPSCVPLLAEFSSLTMLNLILLQFTELGEMLLHPTDLQLQPITQPQPIMDLQDVLVPSTPSSRPILRLTSSGGLDTGLELSMEDK